MLSILLIPVLIAVAGIIYTFAPQIASFLIETLLGGEPGIYGYLIELPLAESPSRLEASSPATSIGPAILNLYGLMKNLSFIIFSIILVVAGLCYALESFTVMSEGTATNIVMGGLFTLIMIFLVLPLYNAAAGFINILTNPSSNWILKEGVIDGLAASIMKPPPLPGGGWEPLAHAAVSFLMSIFFLILVMGVLIVSSIFGILRVFLIGACIAIMPLLLILRLIPLTRRVTESFIEVLIGLMIGSLMVAIFLRFGWEVIKVWGGLPSMVAAIATLIASALMPTVMAPRIGTLFLVGAGIATHAVSTAASGITLTAAGATVGAVTGAYGSLKSGLEPRRAARAALAGGAVGLARGWLQATIGGAPTFRAARYFRLPGLGSAADVGALIGVEAGKEEVVKTATGQGGALLNPIAFTGRPRSLMEAVSLASKRKAGSILEALSLMFIAMKPHPQASVENGLRHQVKVAEMDGFEAGRYILGERNQLYKRLRTEMDHVGSSLKNMFMNLPPLQADSYIKRMRDFSRLNGGRWNRKIAAAIKDYRRNFERLRKIMSIPEIAETAADDLLVHWGGSDLLSGTTTQHGMKEQERISKMNGEEVLEELYGGTVVADEIPARMRRRVGETIKKTILNVPPLIASNIIARANQFKSFDKEQQRVIMEEARKLRTKKEDIFKAYVAGTLTPDLDRMDNSLHYAIDLFNPGTLTERGRTIMAKLIEGGAKREWNPNVDLKKGLEFLEKCRRKITSDPKELGNYIADLTKVELTPQEAEKFGNTFWQLFKNADKHDKKLLILANIAAKIEDLNEWNKLMTNPEFTLNAVKNADNYETQAWITNLIFMEKDRQEEK